MTKTKISLTVISLLILLFFLIIKGYNIYMNKIPKKYSFMKSRVQIYDNEYIYYLQKGCGERTVIFLPGSGVCSVYTDMYELWNTISKFSSVFIYDRFGMGESSCTNKSRNIDNLVEEFNTVLEKTNQKEPYIIVAHSLAGIQAIRFAQKYPQKVDGIVFLDSASPQFCSKFDDPMKRGMSFLKLLRKSGVLRFLTIFPNIRKQFEGNQELEQEVKQIQLEMILKNLWNQTMINERKEINHNGQIVYQNGKIEGVKIKVITAGKNRFSNWDQCQAELMKLSSQSEQILFEDADHFIHHDYPQEIIEVINGMIKERNKEKVERLSLQ